MEETTIRIISRTEGLCEHFAEAAERVGMENRELYDRIDESLGGRCAFTPICRWRTAECNRNAPYSPGIRQRTKAESLSNHSGHEYGYRIMRGGDE